MRPSSAATKCSIEGLASNVWAATADGREDVLDAMVELGDQHALLILCQLTLGDINVDTNHPVRAPISGVGNETSRLDPANLAARSNDAILYVISAPPFAEGLTLHLLEPNKIL